MSIVEKLKEALQTAQDTEQNVSVLRIQLGEIRAERNALINELGRRQIIIAEWHNKFVALEKERDELKEQLAQLSDIRERNREMVDINRDATKIGLARLSDSDLLDEIGRRINKRIFPEVK